MAALVGEPSRELPDVDFALGGRDFQGDTGRARLIGDVPFNVFPRAISAARVNLCITRRSHATVYASSSCRPFELAAARRGDRREPVRRDRALVRAGQRAARRRRRRRGGRGVPRRCSTTRRRPRRWAAARASACSTSTPTGTARGGCSSWSAWGWRRMSTEVAGRAAGRRADSGRSRRCAGSRSSRPTTRSGTSAACSPSCARSTPASTSSSSPTARPTAPPRSPRAAGAHVLAAAVQPRHRRRRADRRSATRGRTATSSPCASTATASTTRPSSRSWSRRCSRARPTSRSARASSASGGYRSSAARRVGIRVLAWVVSTIARQRVTDTTSGFQALNRRAIGALRRRPAARLPRGRGARDGDPPPLRVQRGAGDDARARARPLVDRRARARSTTWSRCCSRSSSASSAATSFPMEDA